MTQGILKFAFSMIVGDVDAAYPLIAQSSRLIRRQVSRFGHVLGPQDPIRRK